VEAKANTEALDLFLVQKRKSRTTSTSLVNENISLWKYTNWRM